MTSIRRATHAYIGIDQSGSVRAICMDDPGEERDTRRMVREWRAMGRRVERLPVEEALLRFRSDPQP